MIQKSRISLDVFAIIIALIAATFTGWQIHETKKHNKLSLRPHIDASYRASNDLEFRGLRIDNAGLGPAFIEDVKFSYNSKPIIPSNSQPTRPYLQVVLDKAGWPKDSESRDRILRTTLPKGAVISPGSEIYVFKIASKLSTEEFQKLLGLEMEITYKSIYEETCKINFDPKSEDAYIHTACR